MMPCDLVFVRQDGDRYIHRCRDCGTEVRSKYEDPSKRRQMCGVAHLHRVLTTSESKRLFPEEDDQTLLGNRIAALTTALGIPPCGGCGKRKEWLNKAHLWLRGELG